MSTDRAPEPDVERQHVAHFYGSDEELLGRAVEFLLDGLRHGAGAVVIAGAGHRDALAARLRAADAPVDRGYLAVDAAETMARFIDGGEIDRDGFEPVILDLVRRAAPEGGGARAYGEMVGLLWGAGDIHAAIELDRLWDRLSERLGIDVFCSYPLDGVDVGNRLDAVLRVCALHDATYGDHGPLPRREDASSVSVVLPASLSAPAAARRLVVGALRRWGVVPVADDAALVASELATNAVLHARGPFTVEVRRCDDRVRVTVTDRSAGLAVPRTLGPGATSGRGLHMVAAVATAWGTGAAADGKTVWAELPVLPRSR
jgi:anti-sigma regulatory factor (Ser/Thr protein kinase)